MKEIENFQIVSQIEIEIDIEIIIIIITEIEIKTGNSFLNLLIKIEKIISEKKTIIKFSLKATTY
jgi:hypothetical protein